MSQFGAILETKEKSARRTAFAREPGLRVPRFERLDMEAVPWDAIAAMPDAMFTHSPGWLGFIMESQGGQPLVAALKDGRETLGYYTGIVVRRFGVKMVASPLRGWTTPYMGFALLPNVPRQRALAALEGLAGDLGCAHIELLERNLAPEEATALGFDITPFHTFVTDLSMSEEALFANMAGSRRRAIRKSEKEGVSIEVAEPEGFAGEYYEQLLDVFDKQDLKPPYGVDRVESLIRHVHPTGDLLLLRARDPNGLSIATGIFAGRGSHSYFWGNASFREHQHLRPNEPLHWFALTWWKRRGVRVHDWGGGGSYKEKYGATRFTGLRLYKSRSRVLRVARRVGEAGYWQLRRLEKRVRRRLRSN